MQSNCASSLSSKLSKLQLNDSSGRDYLSKVGRYLGFKTVSTPSYPFDNHLTTLVSSTHFSRVDSAESVTSESDIPLFLDFPHDRVLKHALSAPTIHPYSPSVASTKCLSSAEDIESFPLTFSLRTRSLPTALDERAGPTTVRPNAKRCWVWELFKGNKHPWSSLTFPCIPSVPSRKFLPTTSPSKSTFVPTSPLSEIFPANCHNLQLAPVLPNESDMLDVMDYPPDPEVSRQKSLNKLSRTLGVPLHDFEPRDTFRTGLRSRRMTLSHNLTSTGVPSDASSYSRKSLSTLNTGDHRFNLADDISDDCDDWAEICPGSRTNVYSPHPPISPITFNPPTPVTAQLPRLPRVPSTENMILEGGPLPSSSRPHVHTTLHRSRSKTFAPLRSKFNRLVASPDTTQSVLDNPASPIVNGPESTRGEVGKARNFLVEHPEYIEEFRSWSRQWNQDSLHCSDVTKA